MLIIAKVWVHKLISRENTATKLIPVLTPLNIILLRNVIKMEFKQEEIFKDGVLIGYKKFKKHKNKLFFGSDGFEWVNNEQ